MMFNEDSGKYYLLIELFYHAMVADGAMLERLLCRDRMQGIRLEESDKDGQTPLMAAVTAGNWSTARVLLEYGANVNAVDDDLMDKPDRGTPLRRAVSTGQVGMARLLLESGADPNLRHLDNASVLMLAAGRRDHAMVDLLLEHGADVNAVQEGADQNETALSRAACEGDLVLVKRLLDAGAKVADSPPALVSAGLADGYAEDRLEDYKGIVRLLLQEGADINAQGYNGWTALIAASGSTTYSSAAAVRFLLEQGAEVNIKSRKGESALFWAASNGDAAAVRLLLDAGARVDDADDEGRTPLMWVSLFGDVEVLRILLAAGADAGRVDGAGRTAADRAEEIEDPEEKRAVLSLLHSRPSESPGLC